MFEQMKAKTDDLNAKIEALRKEAAELMKPMLQEFVVAHPEVKQVKWTQYTPYFNDGDTCTFSLHSVGFYFEGDDLSESHYEHEVYGKHDPDDKWRGERCKRISADTWEACQSFEQALNSNDDALLATFGDHCMITLTANGVEVEEYEHD